MLTLFQAYPIHKFALENELELKTQALNALLTPQPPITTGERARAAARTAGPA